MACGSDQVNVASQVTFASGGQRCVVRCLGAFRLEDASGNVVHIRTRKARALLAVLAASGRTMSRDAIADLLWSDRGPAQARGSLRQSIFELQHVCAGFGFLAAGRDGVAVDSEQLVTDSQLIRAAAESGDAPLVAALLGECGDGYLTDLDGLDSELDSWLHVQRAKEPCSTIAAALALAVRLGTDARPVAMSIVEEVLRLDPANEQAARAAMRMDHELGDGSALRRHYGALHERLRHDYDAEPSRETAELYARLARDKGGRLPDEAETAREEPPRDPDRSVRVPGAKRWSIVLGVMVVLAVAIASSFGLFRASAPALQPGQPLIAVLPFEQEGAGDAFLAEGLWDDTRYAIARSGAVRVLGRATVAASVVRKLSPDQYRRRFGVAYLLEGAVRQIGNSVRVSVSLTRTSDGVAVWEDSFGGHVGDAFSVQSAIANGIEGKLRGRLAPGGGRRAVQIATTPEVYGLYNRARSLLRTRDPNHASRALVLLRRAVATDPNFAPAWSSLAAAIFLSSTNPAGGAEQHNEARQAAAHALTLAPNLAEAQATLGLIEGDNVSESEAAMRRAVALDPSYAEAWNWLGNALASQARYSEAEAAYGRAVDLDPLWFVPAANLVSVAGSASDTRAVARLLAKLSTAHAGDELLLLLKAQEQMIQGDYSGSVTLLAQLDPPGATPSQSTKALWFQVLTRLGEPDAAARRAGIGDWYGPVVRGERMPPSIIDGKRLSPSDFWQQMVFSTFAARTMVRLGRSDELVRLYRAGFRNPDALISHVGHGDQLVFVAPILASALRSSGAAGEANYLLKAAEVTAETGVRNAPHSADTAARLAYVRAAQGRDDAALEQLRNAIERGWLPDGTFQALDFAQEPAFTRLRGDPRLRTLRKRVLDHIAKERVELEPFPF